MIRLSLPSRNQAGRIRHPLMSFIKHGARSIPRLLGPSCSAIPTSSPKSYSLLVLGICMQSKKNYFHHISSELSKSSIHQVRQKWIVIDPESPEQLTASPELYLQRIRSIIPRTPLLNSLLIGERLAAFDYVIIVDDDIRLPPKFIDSYLTINTMLGFSLSQPARTWNSYISHAITRRNRGLYGRQTNFVEVGPLVCVSKIIFGEIFPLDEESAPMGFGLDLVWPVLVQEKKLSMGIIDCVPVDHSLRRPASTYEVTSEMEKMALFLSTRRHVSADAVKQVIRKFPTVSACGGHQR